MKHSVSPVTLRVRAGTRVEFRPTPASLMLYSSPPAVGARGYVTTVFLGGKRRTSISGPGGGLVYVDWDDDSFQGVSSIDLFEVRDDALAENPPPGPAVLVAGAAAAVGLVWWLFKKPTSSSDACPVTAEKLYAWRSADLVLLWLFKLTEPPSLASIQQSWPQAKDPAKLVVVLSDGSFWAYASGKPVAAPELRKSYCDFVKSK